MGLVGKGGLVGGDYGQGVYSIDNSMIQIDFFKNAENR